jgi:dihydrodipicolinate synthase/N-acetylneuraminate lyase
VRVRPGIRAKPASSRAKIHSVGPAPSTAEEAALSAEDREMVERLAVDVLLELGYPV